MDAEQTEKEPSGGQSMALARGTQLGNWTIVRLLGKGGMAEVYEVEDRRLGTRSALKLFTYARGEAAAARARFVDEARLLAKLHHPRLVRVYDYGEEKGRPYFVMDLVLNPEGVPQTLADVSTAGVDEEQVAVWYEDLREGLAYIHAKGILHRDLKLQNVLVGADGHVVLSDFGVAKIFSPELRANLGVQAEQTLLAVQNGRRTIMGSVGYLAPEVEMGVAASKESDWYALGVTVFRLLTGVWCDARTDVTGDLETYNPVWTRILPKLLHLNPAGRECPSFRELERTYHEEEAYKSEQIYEGARDKLRRAKKSKKMLVGSLLATLLVLAGVGAFAARLWQDRTRLLKEREERLPSFDELCVLPTEGQGPTIDGETAERSELELAQVDAWVATRGILQAVERGECSRAEAVDQIRKLARKAAMEDAEEEVIFSGLSDYEGMGELPHVAWFLNEMANRLEGKKK